MALLRASVSPMIGSPNVTGWGVSFDRAGLVVEQHVGVPQDRLFPEPVAGQCGRADNDQERSDNETDPREDACDDVRTEGDRQADQGEHTEEPGCDEKPDLQTLSDT